MGAASVNKAATGAHSRSPSSRAEPLSASEPPDLAGICAESLRDLVMTARGTLQLPLGSQRYSEALAVEGHP